MAGKAGSSKSLVESARALGIAALINTMRDFPTRAGVQWRALNALRELASESGAYAIRCTRIGCALRMHAFECVCMRASVYACMCVCMCACMYACIYVSYVCIACIGLYSMTVLSKCPRVCCAQNRTEPRLLFMVVLARCSLQCAPFLVT